MVKNTLLLIFFLPFISLGQTWYLELNAGIAMVPNFSSNAYWVPMPGASFLIGKRIEEQNNFLMDMEIGLALPTIATGKIGFGSYINKERKSAILVGVRPWPLFLFFQTNLPSKPKGQWIVSLEAAGSALFDTSRSLSFGSAFIANFGYRWNIVKQ